MSLFLVAVLAVGFLLFVVILRSMMVYIPNNRVGILEKLISGKGSVHSGFIALERRGRLPAGRPARWLALPDAVPVPRPQHAAGHHPAGRDRLRLRARRRSRSRRRRRSPRNAPRARLPGRPRVPRGRRPARARSARSCAKAPTRSTSRSSSCHRRAASTTCRWSASDDGGASTRWRTLIAERRRLHAGRHQGRRRRRIGVVTVHDGPSLPQGEIIAPTVGDDPTQPATYHNNFQDPERVPRRRRPARPPAPGARRGHLLHQPPLRDGRARPEDRRRGRHGRRRRLVHRRRRAATSRATTTSTASSSSDGRARRLERAAAARQVRVQHVRRQGHHGPDDQLHPQVDQGRRPARTSSTRTSPRSTLITKDAFEPSLPLSVVVHIDYRKAPLVVQRFGDVKRLVEQTLDPMVAAYFKNIGQTRTLIQLIQDRARDPGPSRASR